MALTNSDLIADSLRELGVINEVQTPSAEQAAHALRKLNQLMAEKSAEDIDLQFFPQTSLTDTCPIPAFAENWVTCELAIRLASNYGKTVSAELVAAGGAAWDTVLSHVVAEQLPEATVVNRPNGAGWYRRRSRILTG